MMDSSKIGNGLPVIGQGPDIGISSLPVVGYLGKVSELISCLSAKFFLPFVFLRFKIGFNFIDSKNGVSSRKSYSKAKDCLPLCILLICGSRNRA